MRISNVRYEDWIKYEKNLKNKKRSVIHHRLKKKKFVIKYEIKKESKVSSD